MLAGTALSFGEAIARRQRLQHARLSGHAEIFPSVFRGYRLGDAVTMVLGRNFSLQTNRGQPSAFPNIVAMNFLLAPAGQQCQTIELEDAAMASGGGEG